MKKFGIVLALTLVMIVSCACVFSPIKLDYNDGVYHVVLDGKYFAKKINFVASENLISNEEAHKKYKSKLTMNTGFFDPNNQKTISYIVEKSNDTVADPMLNENLLDNPVLRQNLDKVLNRTEFRIVECDSKYHYEIVPHKTPVDFACTIETSAQGGPQILPELRMEEEFFVVKDEQGNVKRESISALHRCARTIIGLKDGDVHLLIFTNSHPLTLPEVKIYCENLGLERAMGFDGGSSTSFIYKDINVTSTKSLAGRKLKSFMIIK
ncbi:MAG: phosphodiester glycosidase family protein [bacterium]|nr:phosphodiester glycosidase family protein [bacterium]